MCAVFSDWCFWQAVLFAGVVFCAGLLAGSGMATADAEYRERALRMRIAELQRRASDPSVRGDYL